MTEAFSANKIQTFTGINDVPVAPTATAAGNGSHLISQHNNLCDSLDASLATVATTGSYTDLADKPTLATVATTGSYTDLVNAPPPGKIDGITINGAVLTNNTGLSLVIQGDTVTYTNVGGVVTITIGTYTPPVPSGGGSD